MTIQTFQVRISSSREVLLSLRKSGDGRQGDFHVLGEGTFGRS
jgi:hypothetical protein